MGLRNRPFPPGAPQAQPIWSAGGLSLCPAPFLAVGMLSMVELANDVRSARGRNRDQSQPRSERARCLRRWPSARRVTVVAAAVETLKTYEGRGKLLSLRQQLRSSPTSTSPSRSNRAAPEARAILLTPPLRAHHPFRRHGAPGAAEQRQQDFRPAAAHPLERQRQAAQRGWSFVDPYSVAAPQRLLIEFAARFSLHQRVDHACRRPPRPPALVGQDRPRPAQAASHVYCRRVRVADRQ